MGTLTTLGSASLSLVTLSNSQILWLAAVNPQVIMLPSSILSINIS